MLFVIERGSRRDKWRTAHPFPQKNSKGTYYNPHRDNGVRYSISDAETFVKEPEERPHFSRNSIEELIKARNNQETFSDYLMALIAERGLTNAEAYKKANVSKSVFHSIWSNKHHVPKKNTVLAFAIALELDMGETNNLLKKAGYAFSNAILFDVLIQYFIANKKYDIFEINEVLYDYNQPLLGMKTN